MYGRFSCVYLSAASTTSSSRFSTPEMLLDYKFYSADLYCDMWQSVCIYYVIAITQHPIQTKLGKNLLHSFHGDHKSAAHTLHLKFELSRSTAALGTVLNAYGARNMTD